MSYWNLICAKTHDKNPGRAPASLRRIGHIPGCGAPALEGLAVPDREAGHGAGAEDDDMVDSSEYHLEIIVLYMPFNLSTAFILNY